MNDDQFADMATAIESRDRTLAAIMREYSGSPEATVEIVSSSDVPGGNNFLSLRKVAVNVGGTGHLVLDKIPSAPNRVRHDMNVRELWLYEKLFRDSRFDFVPEFYGSRVEGAVMQWVFGFIEGAHANFGERSARAAILRTLGTLNALELPGEIPCERTSMQYMRAGKIGKGIGELAAAAATSGPDRALLAEFRAALPAHAARYDRMKRGLSHGDLHRSNILLGKDRKVYLIDWTRWGEHPVGSDVGKYLLGTAVRNGLRIRDVLGGYADAVGADLGDVIFSARYTRIGFLLSFLARNPDKRTALTELLHHAAAIGRAQ